jgi:glycosyltransferase involved in cell wall biosynthesis
MCPKISIITITFNSESTVEETIKSIVSQDYPNLEYIIIDGGSKDRTLEIVNKYKDRIAKVVSEPDEGISDAFNKGIRNATGEIIGIINSDDILLPGALSTVAAAYEEGVGVYRGNIYVWDSESDTRIKAYPSMKFPLRTYKKRIVCHQGTFVAKAVYEKYGVFKKHFKFMMDVDLLIRMYEAGVVFKYIPSELAMFRLGGVTSSLFLKKTGEIERLFRENGAGWLYAKSHVVLFVITNSILTVLRALGLSLFIKKIKFRLTKKF